MTMKRYDVVLITKQRGDIDVAEDYRCDYVMNFDERWWRFMKDLLMKYTKVLNFFYLIHFVFRLFTHYPLA